MTMEQVSRSMRVSYLTASRLMLEPTTARTVIRRLYIGDRAAEDRNGKPPTVQISSPANGTQVVQGSTVIIQATATAASVAAQFRSR